MKNLINGLSVHGNMSRQDAKKAAFAIISLMQSSIRAGNQLDLGFMKIVRKSVKPKALKCNVGGMNGQVLYLGESSKWEVRITKGWQKKTKPVWSRYYRINY